MSDFSSDLSRVNPVTPFKPKPIETSFMGTSVMHCEDCPAIKVCKRISNYRKSCPGGPEDRLGANNQEKCQAGVILLLDELIYKLEPKV